MTRTLRTTAVALLSALALALALPLAGPAQAQLTVTQDAKGDIDADAVDGKVDAKKVTVKHGDRRVRLKTRMFARNTLPHEMFQLVDTRGDRTPEFVVFTVIHNELSPRPAVSVTRIDGWPTRKNPYKVKHDGDAVDCGLTTARKREHGRLLNVTTGRGCFKVDGAMPQRLRVSTFGTFEWGQVLDSVPGWRQYGRWVTSA